MYVKLSLLNMYFLLRITNHFSLTFAASITLPLPLLFLLLRISFPPQCAPLYSLFRCLAKRKLVRRSLLLNITRHDSELFKIQNLQCFVNPRKANRKKGLHEEGGGMPAPQVLVRTKVVSNCSLEPSRSSEPHKSIDSL